MNLFTFPAFFLTAVWISGVMAGIPAIVLDHQVTLEMKPVKLWIANLQICYSGRKNIKFYLVKVMVLFSSVQFSLSVISDSAIPCTVWCQAFLSVTISRNLLKLMSIEWMMSFNKLILRHPLFLLPSVFASIRVYSNESVLLIKWPKYGTFRFLQCAYKLKFVNSM